jgi:predicted nuclease with TOPRIM domain
LCGGQGELSRAEILDRLGVRDFARVAQLSAEEAFRLFQNKHDREHQSAWSRFEAELARQTAEIRERFKDELRCSQSERDDLTRRVEGCLREVAQLRERNQELEGEMSKAGTRGKLEEISFEEEARTWAGIYVSEKLAKHGDYVLAFRDGSGAPIEPRMVVDNKDKATVSEGDLKKLIRDTKERRSPVGIIVAREESQLRQHDRERRWGQDEGVWILRTTRQWLPRDLEVLKPVFERMRTEGADFLQKNSALAEEVRRTFVDLDEIEKELKKASKAVETASGMTVKYRTRLQVLCHSATPSADYDLDGICQTVGALTGGKKC